MSSDRRAEMQIELAVAARALEKRLAALERLEFGFKPFENGVQLYFKNTSGDLYSYLVVDSSNNFLMGNDNSGKSIFFNVRATDTTQRGVSIKVDDTTLLPQVSPSVVGSLRIVTVNDLYLLAGDDLFVTPYERHIQIPALLTGNPANHPTLVDIFTVAGMQFGTTGAKNAFFQWELPDDWDGTDLIIEVDWFPDSGAMAGTDTVQWTVEYACVAEEKIHGAGTSKTLTLTNSDDNARYLSIHSGGTMPYNDADQPLTKQDHIYFKVSRNTAVANDFGGSVTVSAFEIIYKSNQIPRV